VSPPRRPLKHSLVKALRRVPDFSSLDDALLLRIVGASTNLFWPAHSIVFEAGTPSEALYIVLSGHVRIRDGDAGAPVIGEIGPGDYFGELSLLLDSGHTKTAEAIEDCELLVLPKTSFEALLRADPDLAGQVRRKRAAEAQVAPLS
jgi:CRP/FNR family cyclic AMP-dependent transcriptional regulator